MISACAGSGSPVRSEVKSSIGAPLMPESYSDSLSVLGSVVAPTRNGHDKVSPAVCFRISVEPSQIIRNATKVMIPSPTQEIQKWRSSNRAM